MAACYAPGATFEDPAFGELHGEEIGAMWRMLASRAEDLAVELRSHDANDSTGNAHWVATYTFNATGRPVVNDISAGFRFDSSGRVEDHRDEFDFRRWARQALGPAGIAVALLPPLRSRFRARARAQLEAYMAENPAPPSASA